MSGKAVQKRKHLNEYNVQQ